MSGLCVRHTSTVQHVSGSDILQCSILLRFVIWHVAFYFGMPARDVICYTLFKVTSIDELATIPKLL